MELEEFKKFVNDNKYTHSDVAWGIGYGKLTVYNVFRGATPMSIRFRLRAEAWMRDEKEKQEQRLVTRQFKIKARDKLPSIAQIVGKKQILNQLESLKQMVQQL